MGSTHKGKNCWYEQFCFLYGFDLKGRGWGGLKKVKLVHLKAPINLKETLRSPNIYMIMQFQTNAREAAELEQERIKERALELKQLRQDQLERARVRHNVALEKELLKYVSYTVKLNYASHRSGFKLVI